MNMLRKIRLALALFFFVFLTLLFLDFTGTINTWFGWMAKLQFLPAILALNIGVVVGLIVLTLIAGRVYCSVICPLGVFQDIVGWIAGKRKKNRYRYSRPLTWLRYGMLFVFLAVLLAGFGSIAGLIEPYSAYGRMAGNLLSPLWLFCNNALAYLAERVDSYAFYSADVWIKSVSTFAIAILTLLVISILAWRGGRTYCNTVCPVGTVLGFVAKYAWFKPVIDLSNCVHCGLCAHSCKASCLNSKEQKIDYSRCVGCMDCLGACKQKAIVFAHPSKHKKSTGNAVPPSGNAAPSTGQVNNARRNFLSVTALLTGSALVAAPEKTVDGGLAAIEDKQRPKRLTPVTPAGSKGIGHLSQHCTACQLCITACPNGILRPSTKLSTFMQPEMSYERGFCRPECVRCSEVCPTGAIKLLTLAEKSSTQVGHAVWIKKNCLVLTDHVACGNCERHCPTGAIQMVPADPDDEESVFIPVVDEERCIGCGACEYLCPARPFSAIYVEGHEKHRMI